MATNRQRELAIHLRLQATFERALTVRSGRLIVKHANAAAENFVTDGIGGAIIALRDAPQDWMRVLTAHYAATAKAFGDRTREQLDPPKSRRYGLKIDESEFQRILRTFIEFNALEQSTILEATTLADIRAGIQLGTEAGLGPRATATLFRDIVAGNSVARARTIARTETHNAATFASQETAKATGFDLKKEWMTALDGRAREAHIVADTQTVPMAAPYIVGGERLMRPGDSSLGASAENVINCRCAELYHQVSQAA